MPQSQGPAEKGWTGTPDPSLSRPESHARASSILEPEAPPEALFFFPAGAFPGWLYSAGRPGQRGHIPAGGHDEQQGQHGHGKAGDQAAGEDGQQGQAQPGDDGGTQEQAQRVAAADPGRDAGHHGQHLGQRDRLQHHHDRNRGRRRRVLSRPGAGEEGIGILAVAAFAPGLLEQVGVGFRPAPRAVQLAVGRAGLRVAGQVPAVVPVGMGLAIAR